MTVLVMFGHVGHLVRHRAYRARAAFREGDRGALSIEMALLVIALLFAAGLVVVAIKTLVQQQAGQIQAPNTGTGGGGSGK
ncbi:hypothetical protein [Streptacidiphilus monticola]|uniref:DUF2970 domain-containing protein n=1 Tax=Streptacidiphilus monticola TaxID=2161674 RepID=A0ABW1G6Y4_9ACTN